VYVEAAIDFPEEEIDFLSDGKIEVQLDALVSAVRSVLHEAGQGSLLLDGIQLVIAGEPNAGKSSLLNALSGQDSAIVTSIPGTTRDTIRETINIDGLPIHIVDTAGLRDSPDEVEKLGMERARREIERSDHVLFVVDATTGEPDIPGLLARAGIADVPGPGVTLVYNKTDLLERGPGVEERDGRALIYLSALTGDGLDMLKGHLKTMAGYESTGENLFTARRRHIDALERVLMSLNSGKTRLAEGAGELLAEELRQAQHALGEITGVFTSDDLLGEIFGSFCVGK
jgi:tRNA modification GTPase